MENEQKIKYKINEKMYNDIISLIPDFKELTFFEFTDNVLGLTFKIKLNKDFILSHFVSSKLTRNNIKIKAIRTTKIKNETYMLLSFEYINEI